MHSKKLRIAVLCVLLMATASTAFAAPMTSNSISMPRASSTGAVGANPVIPGKSPTTGLDWTGDYRPLVVQIENDPAARPHINFSEADIVYEAIYWGPSYTRYTVIYSDNHPEFVGSVRSARWHHCSIRQEWDAPFVFWGGHMEAGAANIIDYFETNMTDKVLGKQMLLSGASVGNKNTNRAYPSTNGADILFRLGNQESTKQFKRLNPHDAAANLAKIVSDYWPKNDDGTPYTPRSHAFKFSTSPSRGQDTAKKISIIYDEKNFYPSYTFNAETREYERWYCGQEQVDAATGKRIVASNVIVQFAEINYPNGNPIKAMINLETTGIMDAFIDGRHIRGTWSRASANDRTIFMDMNGEEITLLPGKTFVQIIPTSYTYTYVSDDGVEHSLDVGTKVEEAKIDSNFNTSEMDKME